MRRPWTRFAMLTLVVACSVVLGSCSGTSPEDDLDTQYGYTCEQWAGMDNPEQKNVLSTMADDSAWGASVRTTKTAEIAAEIRMLCVKHGKDYVPAREAIKLAQAALLEQTPEEAGVGRNRRTVSCPSHETARYDESGTEFLYCAKSPEAACPGSPYELFTSRHGDSAVKCKDSVQSPEPSAVRSAPASPSSGGSQPSGPDYSSGPSEPDYPSEPSEGGPSEPPPSEEPAPEFECAGRTHADGFCENTP